MSKKANLNNIEMKEKGKATFVSYIEEEEESEVEEVENKASAFYNNRLEPHLLQGEIPIKGADSVLMFAPFSNRKQGISGHLFVTNFKISFVTGDKSSYVDGDANNTSQRNKLIGNKDIPLTNVDSVYQVSSGDRRKKLTPGVPVTTYIKYLEIHCNDFQIHVFGFKFTPKDQNKELISHLMKYAFPESESMLFARSFGERHQHEREDFPPQPEFCAPEHWERELERLQCQSYWRVTHVNRDFTMSYSLPEFFVMPKNLFDTDIKSASRQFIDQRVPTWSYTYPVNGATLIRMSQVIPESDFKSSVDRSLILKAVKQSTDDTKDLVILDLHQSGRWCPSLLDVRTAFEKLKSIILTDSSKTFYSTDSRWFSNLEGCQWLQHVSLCLKSANHVVNQFVRDSQTIVLKEESGTDFTALISCLVQLQLDSESRTIRGFQSLVQKEWVVMGHQFQKRLGLILSPNTESEQAPVFLLFLDCVWQLLQQFPSSFAFTETYLTSLWDSVHLGLFDTFLFNSCRHRRKYLFEGNLNSRISLPSAWDWRFHLNDEQMLLFNNPLYTLRTSFDLDHIVHNAKTTLRLSGEQLNENRYSITLNSKPSFSTDMSAMQETVLSPEVTTPLINLWSQCFLRWIVPAQIVGGGNPSQYMQQCILVEEVICLQHKLKQLTEELAATQASEPPKNDGLRVKTLPKLARPSSGLVFGATGYQNTNMQLSSVYITSSYPFSPGVSHHTQHSLICGPLSKYLKEAAIDYDYDKDADD